MKTLHRALLILSLALLALALAVAVFGRYWTNPPTAAPSQTAQNQGAMLVDEQPLATAQQLAALAVTQDEQAASQNTLRIADHEVDLAFASALRNATMHAPPLTAAARVILAHVQELQTQVKVQGSEIARLKAEDIKASDKQKQSIEDDLGLQQALMDVSQEELDEAQQELVRAGGDPKTIVQQLQEQHESSHQQINNGSLVSRGSEGNPEETQSHNMVAEFRAWRSLNAKDQALSRARQEVNDRRQALLNEHADLEKEENGGGSQKKVNAAQSPSAQASTDNPAPADSSTSSIVSTLRQVAETQMDLAELYKRVQDFRQLDTIYADWDANVKVRKEGFLIGLAEAALWVSGIFLLVILADPVLRSIFSKIDPEGRRLHVVRVGTLFTIQFLGAAMILLLIFGPPSQLATVIALAGAGLTVALKDFIVGFIGWFALMGPHGIRPGDWVEIDGVGGQVLEVGPLHTILLETGSRSDAGNPTGRKVSIVNSYAIEGHYYNFSTTGQWLWDEIQIPVPSNVDPHPIVDAIQSIVASETEANTKLAEHEWQHILPGRELQSFSAAPSISVQPTSGGINVIIRYITHPQDLRDVRARLYGKIIDILRANQVPSPPKDQGPGALPGSLTPKTA